MERTTPKRQAKAQAKMLASPGAEHYQLDYDEQENITVEQLTPQEKAKIAKARARAQKSKAKREETKALTGIRAEYPTLSHSYSEEVAINMVG